MSIYVLIFLLVLFPCFSFCFGAYRPKIGILSQPITCSSNPFIQPSDEHYAYVNGAYVEWIRMGGGDAVAVPFDAPESVLRKKYFEQLNGIIFPGGGCNLTDLSSPMMHAAQLFFDWSLASFEAHRSLPPDFSIWGTCQGLQILMVLAAGDGNLLDSGFNSSGVSFRLDFVGGGHSRMFHSWAPPEYVSLFSELPITVNWHHLGLTIAHWEANPKLGQIYDLVSTSTDLDGTEFVSTFEGKGGRPLYGVQWHPEIALFEDDPAVNPLFATVLANQLTANFFVNQTRASSHRIRGPAGTFYDDGYAIDLSLGQKMYLCAEADRRSTYMVYVYPRYELWGKGTSSWVGILAGSLGALVLVVMCVVGIGCVGVWWVSLEGRECFAQFCCRFCRRGRDGVEMRSYGELVEEDQEHGEGPQGERAKWEL